MSNDAQGNPIVEGSKYLEAATAKQDADGLVTLGDGVRVALPADLYPTSALGGGGGGGVTDHGALTGLGDDGHTQYHNDTRGDVRYYTKATVDSALAGKANSSHTHTLSDITDAGDAAGKDVGTASGTVAAGDHGHVAAAIAFTATDRLLGRATAGAGAGEEIPCTAAGRALIDDVDAAAQRTTLGLGTAAVEASSAFAAASHTHTLADVTDAGTAAAADTGDFAAASHTHVAADVTDLGDAATKNVGTTAGTVAAGDHNHSGVYAPVSHTHTLADVTDAGDLAALDTVGTAQIADDAVTYAKAQNVTATDRVLGRSTAGAGIIEEIPCTAAGRSVIGAADAGAQRTALGLGSAAVADSSAFAAASHSHVVADITDAGALAALDTVGTSEIDPDAVTYPKIQNVTASDRILGRATAGAGVIEEITCTAAGRAILDDANAAAQRATLGLGTAAVEASSAFLAAGSALGALSDVDTTGAANGDRLELVAGVWEPVTPPILPAYLQQANNLSDLANAATARTNLGLGTAATQASTAFLQVANDLSDLNDPATARTNLELGTAAEEDSTAFATAAHTHAEFNWLRQQESPTWVTQSTGWSSALSGSGISALGPGQFYAASRAADALILHRVSTGTATAGTNAAVRRLSNTSALYLPDGRVTIARMSFESFDEIQTVRIGFFGNATAPAATGRPSNALFVELDKAVGADWYLVGTKGGTPSTDSTGITATGADVTFAIVYESSSSAKLYTVSSSGAAVEVAAITTNILTTTNERSGGVWCQVTKRTTGVTSANGHVLFDVLPVMADNNLLRLP